MTFQSVRIEPDVSIAEDSRARYRGFASAGHYLLLAARALDFPTITPRWVWREYRAIYGGEMWRRQASGGIEEDG